MSSPLDPVPGRSVLTAQEKVQLVVELLAEDADEAPSLPPEITARLLADLADYQQHPERVVGAEALIAVLSRELGLVPSIVEIRLPRACGQNHKVLMSFLNYSLATV